MSTILDGGCVLHEFPGRPRPDLAPRAPKVWRPMTEEECVLALSLSYVSGLIERGADRRENYE
jgi:hypothetical protein